jgi:hypothetical protein
MQWQVNCRMGSPDISAELYVAGRIIGGMHLPRRPHGRWTALQRTCLRMACALGVLGLSSCAALNVGTVNVAYEHADWLLQRMAAHYVDFDAGQAQAVRTGFGNLHAWHRSQELPVYAELMDAAAARMERGLRRDDVVWIVRAINDRWQVVGQRLAGEMTPVLVTLTPGQVQQMERKLADDNAKFAKTQVSADVRKADKHRADWLVDQFARWTGELTPAQRQRIELAVKQTEDFPALRLAERRRRQSHFLELVRDKRDPRALGSALNDMLSTPREGADEAYRRSVARYEEQMTQMVLDLDRTLSPEQRATAASRMRRYAQSFRALAVGRT